MNDEKAYNIKVKDYVTRYASSLKICSTSKIQTEGAAKKKQSNHNDNLSETSVLSQEEESDELADENLEISEDEKSNKENEDESKVLKLGKRERPIESEEDQSNKRHKN